MGIGAILFENLARGALPNMASASQHLRQAYHNESVANKLLSDNPVEFPDWAVTATFYAALHFVNHYFMRTASIAPGRHDIRSSYLNRDSIARSIACEYQKLRDRCDEGRYYCSRAAPDTARNLVNNELQTIKSRLVEGPPKT